MSGNSTEEFPPDLSEVMRNWLEEIARARVIRTMAHEVGHVLIGAGHPDQPPVSGVAPLAADPFLHFQRLMASGGMGSVEHELVKGEWDEIKVRLAEILSRSEE